MELKRDDYCDECWLIVSNENQQINSTKVDESLSGKFPTSPTVDLIQSISFKNLPENLTSTTILKVGAAEFEKSNTRLNTLPLSSPSSVKGTRTAKFEQSNAKLNTSLFTPTPTQSKVTTRSGITFLTDGKSERKTGSEKSHSKSHRSNISSRDVSSINILSSQSEILEGVRPYDSDLCLECLVKEYRNGFEKNLLRNVHGSENSLHECRMICVQKHGRGRYMQICSDSDCPRFKFWKILDSAGAGWMVDTSFEGCFPPPTDVRVSSCFATSDGLCSKEQLVELSKMGLCPRIMDEVRPDIEVSEWICGRRDSTSRYGFKVSLLDSHKLMMNVYGECRTLEPPDGPTWRKVTYTFRNYEPGVRYVLFHHGGRGEYSSGPEGEREGHPGSKMTGASVQVKLPTDRQT